MYDAKFYAGLATADIRQKVIEQGFDPILIRDHAGYEYTPHTHPETKLLAFLEGSMDVRVEGQVYHCQAGDRLLIPGDTVHAAVVGAQGCAYFWSEKLL
ncbi:MAG: AraC family ligand binding domain-containing protein [Anaerolineae bacterium]|nr:AraC family ligand binding domain-containing protein [Anaerolineae bacterium]